MSNNGKSLLLAAALCVWAAAASSAAEPVAPGAAAPKTKTGQFVLPPLPYVEGALSPFISTETVQYHYGKHHKGYVTVLNNLTAGKPEAGWTLEELVKTVPTGPLFNAAAQVWNHTFYWNSLKPNGGGEPSGDLAAAIARDFGSFEQFREQFAQAAGSLFGSGWVWLVLDNGKLKVAQTSNADNPLRQGQTPLLTLDVWEHAYYIDYRNARPKYVEAFWKLVNWKSVAGR
jgi:Fe-Mn family superoxide dismutase